MPDSPAVGTVHKDDRPLTTIDQWHRFAPPKRDIHWKDGRSAKENARAWIDAAPGLQPDIAQTLAACRDIGLLRQWCAEPEDRIAIDRFRGEQPNIDLLLVAEDDHGPVVIAIEAKAGETFGNELAYQYQRARAARASNPRSKAVARIEPCSTDLPSISSNATYRSCVISFSQRPLQCLRRPTVALQSGPCLSCTNS